MSMTQFAAQAPKPFNHPIVFLLLYIPFGACSGFVSVTIVYLLGRAGVGPVDIAILVSLSLLPQTIKFIYAPLVDLTFSRKKWFVFASISSAISIAALGCIPANEAGLPWLKVLVLICNFSTALLSMAVESLMAHNTPPAELGRTAGWFQSGNLGGNGLGGGLALVIAENTTQQWLPGFVLALICLLTGIAIRFTHEPEQMTSRQHQVKNNKYLATVYQSSKHAVTHVFQDIWQVAKSRMGYLGLLICFLPIGSGAAVVLFPLYANEWGADANDVAMTSGVMNGLLSALGCVVGGYFCDRMDRKIAYCLFGLLMSACAATMALAPHNLTMYYLFVMLYAFTTGMGYAAFTAFTLEAIGKGAIATKYSIFASLSNTPIAYMSLLNTQIYQDSGSNAGLYCDALMGIVGILIFLVISRWRHGT
jgi:MFS family permease